MLNLAVIELCNLLVKAFAVAHTVYIEDRAAFFTNKMRVARGNAVIALLPVDIGNRNGKTLLLKQSKIAVNRAEAEIGIFILKSLVNPFGGRMSVR